MEQANNTFTLTVTGMSCQGCVSKVRRFIQSTSPDAVIEGWPKENKLMVTSHHNLTELEAIVEEAGFVYKGVQHDSERAHNVISLNTEPQTSECVSSSPTTSANSTQYTQASKHFELSISGMTCAGCVNSVKKALSHSKGVITAEVNFANHTAQVESTGEVDALIEAVKNSGYQASLILNAKTAESDRVQRELLEYRHKTKASLMGLGLGIPLMLYGVLGGSMTVSTLTERSIWFAVGLLTLWIMVRAGAHYFRGAWKAFTVHQANMDLLIALGTASAWFYSMLVIVVPDWFPLNTQHLYFEASVMIIGLINLGQALELRARRNTSQALHRLLDLRPKMATRVAGTKEHQISVSDIQVGDILRVRSGEKIPVDGVVLEGLSTVNESMLTGEAAPIVKNKDSLLSAGTVNGQGSLLFQATHIGADTRLAQIISMVGKAQNSKPPISVLADKVSAVFVPSVIIIAILTALVWYNVSFYFAQDSSLYGYILVTSISVLIIACPCALGLATPISTMIGIGKAAEYGGLIRNGDALQRASELTVLVLDKTGTITQGKPQVVSQAISERAQEEVLLPIVAALERRANHPLADALLQHCEAKRSVQAVDVVAFDSLIGLGVTGQVNNQEYFLGNERLMKEKGIPLDLPLPSLTFSTATPVYLSDKSRLLAIFLIEDPLKQGVEVAISNFKAQGLKVIMLTGDHHATATHVANEVGIQDFHAQLMPNDKLDWIKQLQAQGEVVGMIGDGINDAPALAQADVGFAMGAGTDIAMESADITLLSNDLHSVADVIQISRATLKNIKQNLWGAFIYNGLGIPIAAGILFPFTGWLLSPVVAGAAMSLSSVTVVSNANRLRLLRISRTKT